MGVYSRTQYQLRHSVAYSLDDIVTGTAEANSSNTLLVCSYLTEGDDYYKGYDFHIYAGTDVGTERKVSSSNSTNTTVTVSPAFATALATNSKFEGHKKFTTAQYDDAINRAIEMGKDNYLLDKIDANTALVTDQYEYNVSGFRYICEITREDLTTANTYCTSGKIDGRHWEIIPGTATNAMIKFNDSSYTIGSTYNTKKLRLIGQSLQATLSNDADSCLMPSEFVIQQARALLLDQIPGAESQADRAQSKAIEERRRMITPPYSGSKSVFEV